MRDFRFDDVTRGDGREIVVGQPFLRVAFAVGAGVTRFERLEHNTGIAEIFVVDLIKVVHAAVKRHILAPPIGVFGEVDKFTGLKFCHSIGAGADGGIQGGGGEIFAFPLGFLQDGAQAEDQWEFAVDHVEGEFDGTRAGNFGFGDFAPCRGVAGLALDTQFFKGPEHVFGCDRIAVRESGAFTQSKFYVGAGLVSIDRFGQKAVKAEGFVVGPAQKRFNRKQSHPCWGLAFDDVGVQAVKAARLAKGDGATFGGIGVGIGQGHKIRWKGGVAIHSYTMFGFGEGNLCRCAQQGGHANCPHHLNNFACHRHTHIDPREFADLQTMRVCAAIQTFNLATGGLMAIPILLLDRFLACMKPASITLRRPCAGVFLCPEPIRRA